MVFAGWQQQQQVRETCCLDGFLFGRVFKGVLQGVPALASTLLSQAPSPKGACCSRCGCNEHCEISPWKLRWAEQPQGKLSSENLGTAMFLSHVQGKRSLAPS